MTYVIRTYHPNDFPEYHRLVAEILGNEVSSQLSSQEFLQKKLQRPRFIPHKDLFLAELKGRLIGFLEINPEPDINRVIVEGGVLPSQRNIGVGSKLLERVIERSQERKATRIHFNISQKNVKAARLLSRKNFRMVRIFWEMGTRLLLPQRIINLKKKWKKDHYTTSSTIHHLQKGKEAEFAHLQNRCFQNTWGFQPNTGEDISFRINLYGGSYQDILIAELSNQPVAYCWTLYHPGKKYGHILMLGVVPEYRGLGLSKQILSAGMDYLKNKGARNIELTADSSNQAALQLYQSFGFRKKMETHWYELRIQKQT